MEYKIYKLENPITKYFHYYLSKNDEKRAKRNIKLLHKREYSELYKQLLDDMKHNRATFTVIYNDNQLQASYTYLRLYHSNVNNIFCLNHYRNRHPLIPEQLPIYSDIDELKNANKDVLYKLFEEIQLLRQHLNNQYNMRKLSDILTKLESINR
jgi:hypothetical protein